MESWIFEETFAEESLLKHFQTHSLKGFGIESMRCGIIAAGAILYYLKETEHPNLKHISTIQRIERDEHLWMDRFTIRNLEILSNGSQDGNNLLKVLDNTVTPMGARLLKRWIVLPLKDM
ncbi:MAG: DNA mismatch repair protein MutS, partial [Arachidicoccus sp.]